MKEAMPMAKRRQRPETYQRDGMGIQSKPITQSIKQACAQSSKQTVNYSANQSMNQLINHSTIKERIYFMLAVIRIAILNA